MAYFWAGIKETEIARHRIALVLLFTGLLRVLGPVVKRFLGLASKARMVLFSGDNLPKSFVPQPMLLTFIVFFHLKTTYKTSKHSYKHRGNSLFMLLCTKPQKLLGSHPQEHKNSWAITE